MMPVMAVPSAMPAPMPMAVMPVMVMPADLYGLDLVDFFLRHDGRLKICRRHAHPVDRNRRNGSGLRTKKYGRAQHQSCTKTQNDSLPHDVMPFP
jgi:hypothetical protein